MKQNNGTVKITIDNKTSIVEKDKTILQAAEQNDIYIPTLCAHKDLTPFGGCRMCLVEVEGARGFLTACTTPIEEGMIIRTHTDQIQRERREILELMLSEHTSSCLICDERVECKKTMSTIRKVGVTTGCRYCPNDDRCDLAKVVEWLNIKEINYPVYYRNLRIEKEDPFYDRDYNLCILCGRCVRICQEVRNANVLAFNQRGRHTVIGPAFNRTHIEAGCEFCGSCVSVCPTGSLSEKSNKWNGVPEAEVVSTCVLCGVGCQLRVLIKENRVIGTLPAEDDLVNNGQLCVKGRFCVNELVNHYQRLKKPVKMHQGAKLNTSWDEAVAIAAQTLSNCKSNEFAMLISPNCSNEDLYIAQKFTRLVMKSHRIDTSARWFYGNAFNAYLTLMKRSTPLSELKHAQVIVCVDLDMKYGRSVVGVQLRKALSKGAKLITIHPNDHSLTLNADAWIQPDPGEEVNILRQLVNLTKKQKNGSSDKDLTRVAAFLNQAENVVILVGSDIMRYDQGQKMLEYIDQLAQQTNAGVIPLPAQNNLFGSLMMGAYCELLPGGSASSENNNIDKLKLIWKQDVPYCRSHWDANRLGSNDKFKVVYLIGEFLPNENSLVDHLIYQNIYPLPDGNQFHLMLPAASSTEIDGTTFNGEGRLQRLRKAVDPPGSALPDWKILCLIAKKMGVSGFDYADVSEIHREISHFVNGFSDFENPSRAAIPLSDQITLNTRRTAKTGRGNNRNESMRANTHSITEHIYRGVPLVEKVKGFQTLIDS